MFGDHFGKLQSYSRKILGADVSIVVREVIVGQAERTDPNLAHVINTAGLRETAKNDGRTFKMIEI